MRKKNIVYYVTKQYMKQNKKRTFTTFLGIVFMVLLMTCVFVGKDTALNYLEKMAEKKNGSWHYCVYDVNAKQYEEIKNLPQIAETAISEKVGFTVLEQSENVYRPYLDIKAYTSNCFKWRNIEPVNGRFPENDQELIISESALLDGAKLSIGDEISAEFFTRSITGTNKNIESVTFPLFSELSVSYGKTVSIPDDFPFEGENEDFKENREMTGEKKTYKIVGFMKSPSHESSAHAGYAAFTYEEAPVTDSFNVTMKFDFKECKDVSEVEWEINDLLNYEVKTESNSLVLIFNASSGDETMNFLVLFIQAFFIAFILVASVILIYNLFNMSFEERSKYLGMLSSIGATGKQKRSSVYFEALYLLFIALPVGFLIGLGVVKIGMFALEPYVGMLLEMAGSTQLEAASIVLNIKSIAAIWLVCIVAVLISAYLPARKIGKVGAITSIRGEHSGKKSYKTAWFAVKKGSGEALLARNTVKRQKRKTKGIVGAAVIFMLIVIITTFGAGTVTKMVRYHLVDSEDISEKPSEWEYCVSEYSSDPAAYENVKEKILKSKSVTGYVEWYEGMFVGNILGDTYSEEYWNDYVTILNLYYPEELTDKEVKKIKKQETEINVIAVDQKIYEKVAKQSDCDMERLKKENSAIVVQSGELSTNELGADGYKAKKMQFFEIEKMTDKKIGEEIPVSLYNLNKDCKEMFPLTVAGYTTNKQLNGELTFHSEYLWVIVNADTGKALADIVNVEAKETEDEEDENYDRMSRKLYFNVDSSGEALIEEIEKLYMQETEQSMFGFTRVQEGGYEVTLSTAINSVVEILAAGFVLLSSILCLLNLYNSIRGRTEDRKKEFAIMASIGMTRKQMNKMLLMECAGILGKAVLWTVLIATPIVFGLWNILVSYFGNMVFSFPWLTYVVAIGISGVAVFILTLLCYNRQKTENIMDDIRTESV